MGSKLELSLEQANGELVELDNLSGDALSSFLAVVGSLKTIIEGQTDESKFTYRIIKGSASLIVESPNEPMEAFYGELQSTVKDGSRDKSFVDNLKRIQYYLKDKNLDFNFFYYPNGDPRVDLKEKVVSSKIRTKRGSRNKYYFKLEILSGVLNQIGGNNPNYHLDHGLNKKITVFCEKEEAKLVREYLYQKVKCLVEAKTYSAQDKEDVYAHKAILSIEELTIFRPFIREYNKIDDLVERLEYIHTYTFSISSEKESFFTFLKVLCIGFCSENFHQSEIKTVLILTKSLKNNKILLTERSKLLEVYNSKINKR